MKTRNSNTGIETVKQDGGCCGSLLDVVETSNQACCEQTTDDGSPCCDKNESKEVNIEKTGCC
ncbi:hypothetical protein [Flavivirga spongiicola]|uniref:CC domain-containing protein n=1 Tax=Flavivirga spongiicola TaxID=421621 RepID=A0ABU7XPK8_9FLAO|nr:hypothetical protein [Flavivirga sp. MEBiC05379]MDO5977505.1 hypothetical protein [Flavivirga sp. MEBiC05379]